VRFVAGSFRLRWIIAVLVLALALAGAVGTAFHFHARSLSQPQPDRYAPGVLVGETARSAASSGPVARAYLGHFKTQESPSSCGPASVLNVLASIGAPIADERTLFDGDRWGWLSMRIQGMTLDALAALLAQRRIGEVTVLRDLSFEAFLSQVREADNAANRLIVNFDRAPIFGVAIGHFSPIGGYDAERDLVLLLDVTPGYGPSLIPSKLLYTAVQTPDSTTGRMRGLIRISGFNATDSAKARP
jgi:hypothetical protein